MSRELAIGIDLGTTNSVVAVFQNGSVEVLPNAAGELLRPSAVAIDPKEGGLLVGRAAKEVLALRPDLAAAFFKRGMGLDMSWAIGKERYGAIELSALVLRRLADEAAEALGTPVERCVITVPAYFDEEQRAATIKAGELAGLRVERILNEPTAAAMAYGLHNADREMQFMVVDLGGGTFDVCVMELFDGILQVKSTAGENQLGGEDFSRRLAETALAEIGLKLALDLDGGRPEVAMILKRAELAKRRLSVESEARLEIPPIPGKTESPIEVLIDEDLARRAWKPLLDRLMAPLRSALRGAQIQVAELDEIILVGGATRMPIVRDLFAQICGREPLDVLDPDLAVAQGAAIQAALVMQDEAVEEIVVTDVLSHSLGVNVSRVVGGRIVAGYYSPILHRNTTIPSTRADQFSTLHDNQTTIEFDVYEGEARRIEDNRFIGSLKVKGIPKGPAGQTVEARLTVDLNGLLELEVIVSATGAKLSRVFERSSQQLSAKEIEQAKKRMAALKADPTEKPENREVMLRAEALWSELQPDQRWQLEQAIDAFQAALATHDREIIKAEREALRELCTELDEGERW